jgi:DNA polymerase III alpha subunit
MESSVEVVVFSELYNRSRHLLVEDEVIVVTGKVDHKGKDDVKIVATDISELSGGEGGPQGEAETDDEALQLNLTEGDIKFNPVPSSWGR